MIRVWKEYGATVAPTTARSWYPTQLSLGRFVIRRREELLPPLVGS